MTSYQSSMLRALQLENQDQLDMACATYEHALTTATGEGLVGDAEGITVADKQLTGLHAGLFRCQLPDPASLQAMFARADALLREVEEGGKEAQQMCADRKSLNAYRTEAAIRLADWDKLDQAVASVPYTSCFFLVLNRIKPLKHNQSTTGDNFNGNKILHCLVCVRQLLSSLKIISCLYGPRCVFKSIAPSLSIVSDALSICLLHSLTCGRNYSFVKCIMLCHAFNCMVRDAHFYVCN